MRPHKQERPALSNHFGGTDSRIAVRPHVHGELEEMSDAQG